MLYVCVNRCMLYVNGMHTLHVGWAVGINVGAMPALSLDLLGIVRPLVKIHAGFHVCVRTMCILFFLIDLGWQCLFFPVTIDDKYNVIILRTCKYTVNIETGRYILNKRKNNEAVPPLLTKACSLKDVSSYPHWYQDLVFDADFRFLLYLNSHFISF